jgi:hypothetical protein
MAGMELVAHLAHENVSGAHPLTTIPLDAAPLAVGIATIAAGTLTLLVCHYGNLC